jgi:Uma2 family endonuclease
MSTAVANPTPPLSAPPPTFADLVAQLGDVPLERIWLHPLPGTATEQDVLDADDHLDRLCELVDGVLVEKAMGYREAMLAIEIGLLLANFVRPRRLGLVAGEGGMMRLTRGLVRIPDVSFVAWDQLPSGKVPSEPIPDLYPTLAVEVVSRSNRPRELARKRREYFAAGTRLVWQIDPLSRTAEVFTSPDAPVKLDECGTLDGGDVLPGFKLPLAELFAALDQQPPA